MAGTAGGAVWGAAESRVAIHVAGCVWGADKVELTVVS